MSITNSSMIILKPILWISLLHLVQEECKFMFQLKKNIQLKNVTKEREHMYPHLQWFTMIIHSMEKHIISESTQKHQVIIPSSLQQETVSTQIKLLTRVEVTMLRNGVTFSSQVATGQYRQFLVDVNNSSLDVSVAVHNSAGLTHLYISQHHNPTRDNATWNDYGFTGSTVTITSSDPKRDKNLNRFYVSVLGVASGTSSFTIVAYVSGSK